MDTPPLTLQQRIAALDNLADFARRSKLPRRTIDRIKAGGTPSAGTTLLLEQALKKYKPKAKP